MRFYLDFPLIVGYVLMATAACLGMLQLAAARGGYGGLALFTPQPRLGTWIGIGLTVGALLAYVSFAPEILTPGPAGTEVAEMFALCALLALAITLVGADRRIQRERRTSQPGGGEAVMLGNLPATLHQPTHTSPTPLPAIVLLPDPTGFVVTPAALIEALCQANVAVLALDTQAVMESDAPLSRQTLRGHLSTALAQLAQRPGIDGARTGLLGLGLGGDAVLGAAATVPQVKAAMAASPLWSVAFESDAVGPGLQWLYELSYRQVWRWRRNQSLFRRAAADLHARAPWTTASSPSDANALPITAAILQGSDDIMAMRRNWPFIELLTTPGQRHFTLLQDENTIELTAAWFQEKFGINHQSPITNHQHVT
jgi:hypothetical protein